MVKLISTILSLGISFTTLSFADTIVANSPGSLPATAQDLSGDQSLTEIDGTLAFSNGVDVFKIDILNPASFSAYTVNAGAFGVPDPELFLFNASGHGVYENDDTTAIDTQSCLPAADSNNPCPSSRSGLGPLTPGIYYLAITRSANSPLSVSGYIFSPVLSTDVVGPDLTAGGADPITGWDGGVNASPNSDLTQFDIRITDTPEPATWPLLTAALAAVVVFSRKPRTR